MVDVTGDVYRKQVSDHEDSRRGRRGAESTPSDASRLQRRIAGWRARTRPGGGERSGIRTAPHATAARIPDLSPTPPAGRCPAVPPRDQPAAAAVGVGPPRCRPGRLGVVSVPPRSPREIGVAVVTVEQWSHCAKTGPQPA